MKMSFMENSEEYKLLSEFYAGLNVLQPTDQPGRWCLELDNEELASLVWWLTDRDEDLESACLAGDLLNSIEVAGDSEVPWMSVNNDLHIAGQSFSDSQSLADWINLQTSLDRVYIVAWDDLTEAEQRQFVDCEDAEYADYFRYEGRVYCVDDLERPPAWDESLKGYLIYPQSYDHGLKFLWLREQNFMTVERY